jgi:hypothetical protein
VTTVEEQGRADRPVASEAVREAVTMALYVCLVLAAEFVALGDHVVDASVAVGAAWGTTLGLALAHVFAFDLAARLFGGGRRSAEAGAAVVAQLVAAVAVAAVLTVPFAVLSFEAALDAAGFLLASLIGLAAYLAARSSGSSRVRSIVDGLVVLAVAVVVVSLKVTLSGH